MGFAVADSCHCLPSVTSRCLELVVAACMGQLLYTSTPASKGHAP